MPTPNKGGRPPKHGPVPKGKRSGRRVTVDIDPLIWRQLKRYIAAREKAERLRLYRTQVIEKALIEMLERAGHWPPKKRRGKG